MTTVVVTPSITPTPAPVDDSQATVVEIRDEDVPPPGWDQWTNLPAPAPEPPTGVLVVRDDGGVAPGRPADGAEASLSRAVLPTSDGTAVRPEQERECADAPPAHFASAQAEQALWQEFRDHGVSLNRALNEALRIHGGPAWRIFRVSDFSPGFVVFFICFFCVCTSPDLRLLSPYPSVAGFGASGPGEVRHSRPPRRRAQLVPG
jgi:hypothetical protein